MVQKGWGQDRKYQRFEAKTRVVQKCGVNGGANHPFQLITHHSLAQGPQTSHLGPFFPNSPRPSLPPLHRLFPLLKILFPLTPQLTPTYPACLSSRAIFSEDFPLSQLAEFKPILDAATSPVHPQSQQNCSWDDLFSDYRWMGL